MCIAFTIQMYYSFEQCKADKVLYGISERDSFKISFEEAVRYLNNNSSSTFVQVNSSQGLKQIIETGVTLSSALQQHSQDDVILFTDLNNLQNGIIKEVLDFQNKNKTDPNTTIQLNNAFGSKAKVKVLF